MLMAEVSSQERSSFSHCYFHLTNLSSISLIDVKFEMWLYHICDAPWKLGYLLETVRMKILNYGWHILLCGISRAVYFSFFMGFVFKDAFLALVSLHLCDFWTDCGETGFFFFKVEFLVKLVVTYMYLENWFSCDFTSVFHNVLSKRK